MTSARRLLRREGPYLLGLAPAALLVGVFFLFPAVWAVYTGLTGLDLTGFSGSESGFIGLENYRRLADDPDFPRIIRNSVVFVIGSAIVGQFGLGWVLALLFDRAAQRGYRFVHVAQTALLVAWVSPLALAGFVWVGMLDYYDGTLNAGLTALDREPVEWLSRFPMVSVIVADVWRGTAFTTLLLLGALRTVPADIHEAARLDGAGAWRRFRDQTWPSVRGLALLALLMTTILTSGSFILIEVLTSGASFKTMTLPLYAYRTAFSDFQIGYGSAIATVLLALNALFAAVYLWLGRERR